MKKIEITNDGIFIPFDVIEKKEVIPILADLISTISDKSIQNLINEVYVNPNLLNNKYFYSKFITHRRLYDFLLNIHQLNEEIEKENELMRNTIFNKYYYSETAEKPEISEKEEIEPIELEIIDIEEESENYKEIPEIVTVDGVEYRTRISTYPAYVEEIINSIDKETTSKRSKKLIVKEKLELVKYFQLLDDMDEELKKKKLINKKNDIINSLSNQLKQQIVQNKNANLSSLSYMSLNKSNVYLKQKGEKIIKTITEKALPGIIIVEKNGDITQSLENQRERLLMLIKRKAKIYGIGYSEYEKIVDLLVKLYPKYYYRGDSLYDFIIAMIWTFAPNKNIEKTLEKRYNIDTGKWFPLKNHVKHIYLSEKSHTSP